MNEIVFRVVDDSLGETQLDEVLHQLLDELLELHLDATRLRGGHAPLDAGGPELVETAMVVAQAVVDTGVAKALADRVQSWLTRTGVAELVIQVGDNTLTVDKATADDQERLVQHFTGVSAG